MAKQPVRGSDLSDTTARDEPQGESPNAADTGTGTVAVDTRGDADAPTEAQAAPVRGGEPDIDRSSQPKDVPDTGPVPSENVSGDQGLPAPDFEAQAAVGDQVAAAFQAEAAQHAAARRDAQEAALGGPEGVRNDDARAHVAERSQLGVSVDERRLLAANPDLFEVVRAQGVAVYVPVKPVEPTPEQVKAGQVPSGDEYRHVRVPVGAALPDGTTSDQLQTLLTLGWVQPRVVRT